APGVVERRSPFQTVVVGELDGRPSERVARIAAAFRDAGGADRASERIQVELWQKFVFLTALAAACGLARSAVGPLRGDRLGRRLLQRAVEEVVAVARARGIGLPDNEVARVMGVIDGLPPGMKPSFLVDLEAGGPTELEILSGAVARFAEQAAIATPVHDTATVALATRTYPGGASAAGSHIVNVLPAPSVLATVMWPPCSSARSRAIARPRPLPPRSRLRD